MGKIVINSCARGGKLWKRGRKKILARARVVSILKSLDCSTPQGDILSTKYLLTKILHESRWLPRWQKNSHLFSKYGCLSTAVLTCCWNCNGKVDDNLLYAAFLWVEFTRSSLSRVAELIGVGMEFSERWKFFRTLLVLGLGATKTFVLLYMDLWHSLTVLDSCPSAILPVF